MTEYASLIKDTGRLSAALAVAQEAEVRAYRDRAPGEAISAASSATNSATSALAVNMLAIVRHNDKQFSRVSQKYRDDQARAVLEFALFQVTAAVRDERGAA